MIRGKQIKLPLQEKAIFLDMNHLFLVLRIFSIK